MKHLSKIAISLAAISLVTGCASREDDQERTQTSESGSLCEEQYPEWVCGDLPSQESGALYGYGISPPADEFPGQARATARREAYSEVLETLHQELTRFAQDYFEEHQPGSGEDTASRAGVQAAIDQFASAELVGVELVKQDLTSDGRWVVLMSYDLDQDFDRFLNALDHNAADAARRSFEDDRDEFFDEMHERDDTTPSIGTVDDFY